MTAKSLYPPGIRIWHWVNALLFIALILTGIQLRAPFVSILSDYTDIVLIHRYAGRALTISFVFWLLYVLLTRDIKHYLLCARDLRNIPRQVAFYSFGVFTGGKNPFTPSVEDKFNVLQKITYAGVMFILVPFIILTGILFDNILFFSRFIYAIGGLRILDILHVIAGYLSVLFLIIHIYMSTLGGSVMYYMKKMTFGK